MNDRELLELAAEAAGHSYEVDRKGRVFLHHQRDAARYEWNPLADDGDALRLAVKCNLLVDTQYNGGVAVGHAQFCCEDFWEDFGDDPYAATRRAIVRAAAEIGRAMK